MSPKLAVILGLALLVVIGFAFHWWILDVRRIWDWLVYAEPADLPGPDRTPAPWAGEHHPTPDEWEQLDPDEAADVWVAELHDRQAEITGDSWLDDLYRASLSAAADKFGQTVMLDRFDSDSAGGREAYPDPGPPPGTLADDEQDEQWADELHAINAELHGATLERTVPGDVWDQWWAGLDGLDRECLLVKRACEREAGLWAELVAETRELCGAAA